MMPMLANRLSGSKSRAAFLRVTVTGKVKGLDKPAGLAYIYCSATSRGGLVASGAYGGAEGTPRPPRIFLLQILNPHKIGSLRLGKVKNKVSFCAAFV